MKVRRHNLHESEANTRHQLARKQYTSVSQGISVCQQSENQPISQSPTQLFSGSSLRKNHFDQTVHRVPLKTKRDSSNVRCLMCIFGLNPCKPTIIRYNKVSGVGFEVAYIHSVLLQLISYLHRHLRMLLHFRCFSDFPLHMVTFEPSKSELMIHVVSACSLGIFSVMKNTGQTCS